MNITEFLMARVDEDEALAQKAAASISPAMDVSREPIGPAWEDDEGMILGQPNKDGYPIPLWDNEGSSTLSMAPDASAHVARHDPARVLAECAAKRAIIEDHGWDYADPYESWKDDAYRQKWGDTSYKRTCKRCGGSELVAGLGEHGVKVSWPCPTLRTLAAVYEDHPDYQEEWRIT